MVRDVVYSWPAEKVTTEITPKALNAISEIAFGPPMTDPSLVEDAIRRAQLALLNPSVNPLEFVTYTLTEPEEPLPLNSKKKLGFSKNVVCVSVEGPNVADLTLIDLPGIIQAVDNAEDAGNIELVNDLVKEHMAKDCLILLVVTMKGWHVLVSLRRREILIANR